MIQDWHIQTIRPKESSGKKNKAPTITQDQARALKALNETESFKVETVSRTAAQEIRELRAKKGWTQKQLAQAINEKPDVVKAWEAGTAIPNGNLLVKMRKALK